MKAQTSPVAAAGLIVFTLIVVAAMAVPRTSQPQPASSQRPAASRTVATRQAPVTDAQVLAVIKLSDDLEQHQTALVAASRAFMAKGGTLADLREMGGWTRSQTHKPRSVYFTFKRPGTHRRDRWYYDVDRGQLFQ